MAELKQEPLPRQRVHRAPGLVPAAGGLRAAALLIIGVPLVLIIVLSRL